MQKLILLALLFFLPIAFFVKNQSSTTPSGAPPYHVDDGSTKPNQGRYTWLDNWERPDGPARVGLQVGHWRNEEVPDELHRLRGNTGAQGGGKMEWEVNYEIAMLTKPLLESQGIIVDILPATVPPEYWADAFVAIHADGSPDSLKSGYKAAAPRRDYTGKAEKLTEYVERSYEKATGLRKDHNITNNMRGYYAFSFWRFEHAVHPMTVSTILETGFLTSPSDRQLLIGAPEISAAGLANGVIEYLKSEELL